VTKDLDIDGRDIDVKLLRPLQPREINLKTNAGFRKIVASIKALRRLIEPLAVYTQDAGKSYVILDGYLRYMACRQLGIHILPCLVYKDMQAYSFNKNVNRLSACQEIRMLRKSLETIDESTIAQTFGIKSIQYRLASTLVEKLHQHVVKAFQDDLITKICAMEFTYVVPERQAEIFQEMKTVGDYSLGFCRSLVLNTASAKRNKKRPQQKPWGQNNDRKKEMVARLEQAEKQHGFYAALYRQYTTDLLRLTFYVRQLITNPQVAEHLKINHIDVFTRLSEIVLDANA
jgi:ParB family chromosome partitioning protein